jgi:WD40 repeat protein
MADVFVSYSRRDSEFVSRLAESISAGGKEVWLDTEGIADAEVFPEAIKRAIEGSDAFLFVITPASVASPYCENEIDHARDMHKRIVPVLREPVADSELPAEIRDRNWIPFTDQDGFESSLDRLLGALDRDLGHAREHTRWLVKAIEWDGEGRDKSFLLRGSELAAAEGWLAASPEGADPAPTPLQREYLLASRQAAARRQRALAAASLAIAVVSIGLVIFALISRGQAVSAQRIAASRALAAQSENQLAVDPELSILLGMQAVRTSPVPDALFALRAAIDGSPLRMTLLRPAGVGCQFASGLSLAYDPSIGRLAEGVCSGTPGPGRPPVAGRVLIFDAGDGHVVQQPRIGLGGAAPMVAYSPDGSLLAAAGADGQVQLLDAHSGALRGTLGAPAFGPGGRPAGRRIGLPVGLAFSPDGSLLATITTQVKVWSLRRHTALAIEGQAVPGPNSPILDSAVFTHDGRSLVVVGSNGVRVYDARTAALLRRLPVTGSASAIAISPDGSQLAVASVVIGQGGGVVSLWSTRTWRQTATVALVTQRTITAVAFSPDGRNLAIGTQDGSASLLSVRTHDQLVSYLGSTSPVVAIAFMPDRQRIAIASLDGTTKVWRASGPELASIDTGDAVDDVRLVGNRLVAALAPDVVRSWLLPGARPQSPITSHFAGNSGGLFLSPDGAVSVQPLGIEQFGYFTGVVLGATNTGRLIGKVPVAPASTVTALGVSADGRKLLLLGASQDVLDVASRSTVHLKALAGPSLNGITGCHWFAGAISADGRLAAGADQCGAITIWDARTGARVRRLSESGEIPQIAFSPDDRQLAAASSDSTITIWDVRTGHTAHVLHGHTLGVDGVAYSPSGALLASAGLDDTVRVWDPSTGRLLRVWRDPRAVISVAFSSDGSRIVTGDALGTIRIWDACTACTNPRELLSIARGRVTRQLTALERATFLNGF